MEVYQQFLKQMCWLVMTQALEEAIESSKSLDLPVNTKLDEQISEYILLRDKLID